MSLFARKNHTVEKRGGASCTRPPGQASGPGKEKLRPAAQSALVALEARMLFDGAVAASVDALQTDHLAVAPADADPGADITAASFETASKALVVVDPSVDDWQTLVEGLDSNVGVLVLDPAEDGVAQIVRAVQAREPITALHIISHGDAGQVLLGNGFLSAANLNDYGDALQAIGASLSETGDILLYGCDIGDDAAGRQFLAALAHATSADVAASDDLTGAAALGGDWILESHAGQIDAEIVVSAQAQQQFAGLLAPIPTVTIGPVDPAGWEGGTPGGTATDPLLGEDFTFELSFDNTDLTDAGYAPYIDIFVPALGADGGATPDGLTINGATFLGSSVAQSVITLSAADIAAGTVNHPFYTDSSGLNAVTVPAGYQAGDQLIVLELPLGSFSAGQTPAAVQIQATVSELADAGTPLTLTVRSGFRYGADATDNPVADPTVQGAAQTLDITPQLYRVRTSYVGEENEITTGPNYVAAIRIDIDVADGNTLTNLNIGAALDDAIQFQAISGVPGNYDPSPSGSWTNVNGVLVSGGATDSGTPALSTPGGNASRTIASLSGSTGTEDASMVVEFYVPHADASGADVLNANTADDAVIVTGSTVSADWTPADVRDLPGSPLFSDPSAVQIEAQAISIQKTGRIITDTGVAALSAGDIIEYTLDVEVSDYFAFAGDASPTGGSGSQDFLITDTLSDGLDMIDSTTGTPAPDPSLLVRYADGITNNLTLTRGVNYTVSTQASGQQTVVFDLRSTIATANGLVLVGDLFDSDSTLNTAAGATLIFQAQVLETYRTASPDESGAPQAGSAQLDLNEGDWVVNRAVITGTVLDNTLDPNVVALSGEDDDTLVNDQIQPNEVTIDLVGLNGNPIVNDPLNPAHVGAGDCITYRMTYEVPTGDFEDLSLNAFLPLPITAVTDPDADGTPNAWNSVAFTTNPAAGEYAARATGGDGSALVPPTIVPDGTSNVVAFNFGDRTDASNSPLLVEVYFTLCVNGEPFAPGLRLVAQGVQEGQNTAAQPMDSASTDVFVFAAPDLAIVRGVVQDNIDQVTSTYTPTYTPVDPTALLRPAGDTNANPLTGVVSDTSISNLDSDLGNVDAGDQVRFAIVVDNQGTSVNGAFDIRFGDNLPSNIDPASVTNLRIVRGDGTPLNLTNDVRHVGGALVANEADALAGLLGGGLELVDPEEATPGAGGALARGYDESGTPAAAGANVLVVTYDATVRSTVNPGVVANGDAVLSNYAATEGGLDFTVENRIDGASVGTAIGSVNKIILGTDQGFTPDNNGASPGQGDVVIGEAIQYQVTLQVPEGVTSAATFTDTLDAVGLSFQSLDSITASAGVSFDSGAVFVSQSPGDSGGGTANQLIFNLGNITNANSDNGTADTITLTYSAVVLNVATVDGGTLLNNAARLDHAGGALTDAAPNMRIVEPAITIINTPDVTFADAGDTVTYTVILTSNGSSPAFDVTLTDDVPAGMTYVGGSLAQTGGPAATVALTESGGAISAGWAQLNPSDVVTYTFQLALAALPPATPEP